MSYEAHTQDRLYERLSNAIAEAGREKEALFFARLALLLFERINDEQACLQAIHAALDELPEPSLSAVH
ncbi:MAG: hypothetical protein LBJ15_10420 [Comamonas sp.]|jgi:hypothetical protein|uniref:hypothetical protein n=1 Tax=Comamonas sp. TaxID=34028 RepID=UPI002820A9E6|nr:hypothetical protein [Comamonas sp.]MDR0214406.1 hypothetical protein [Comamonas sp.]MDR2298108.1 hypothetical protein [Comamonas sp.]